MTLSLSIFRRVRGLIAGAALLAFSSAALSMVPYSQDFEALDAGDTAALGNVGWLGFGNVFDSEGNFKFGYGTFPAPNDGTGFSGVAIGMGGPAQGNQQLTVYSDYACCGPGTTNEGHFGTDLVESNVFQEQTISEGDVGATWEFSFDAAPGDLAGATTALAFIKTLDPENGFAQTNFLTIDTTTLPAGWTSYSIEITIDPGLVGQLLQFGFNSTASGFEASAVLYDNINFTSGDAALLSPYSQNFDDLFLLGNLPNALSLDGWKVFGAVFDSGGGFKFGYGADAPNGGESFSGIVDDQGDGPARGLAQLSVYSDYACCGGVEGHFNGTDLVEANVFQERSIGLGDVGTTWTFQFDAKQGNIGGASTAEAFIKIIDPANNFALTSALTVDTTAVGSAWITDSISITITPEFAGQLLQFGFANTASNFENSGVFYDNVSFSQAVADTDGDGVTDDVDNCITFANPTQLDSNGDGFGNQCDADLTGSCTVAFGDLSAFKAAFPPNPFNPDADFNENGFIDFGDLARLKQTFFNGAAPGPGPSGVPTPGCP